MDPIFKQKFFKIIHIDMDCFYAQVEMRDNPSLVGLPVAIGGPSKTKGILCTSNYEARAFGVKSAQPTYQAFQLCPNLILLPPNFEKYKSVSKKISQIYYSFSKKVQEISLDEAYIDVSQSPLHNGSASLIAQEIKKEIFIQTGLTASAGVSVNKMLAKIASDWNKPNGIFVIPPMARESFMRDLPLSKIPGIGKVSDQKLQRMGFKVCGDITQKNLFELIKLFGKKSALELQRSCLGISNSEVKNKSQRKSFGIERTFFNAIGQNTNIEVELNTLFDNYKLRFKKLEEFHLTNRDISHLSIKIRFNDFKTYTKEVPVEKSHSNKIIRLKQLDANAEEEIKQLFYLMRQTYQKPIRLIGLGIKFKSATQEQLDFGWA